MEQYRKSGTLIVNVSTGKKLYPVANWEKNQHVFYNYEDIMAVEHYDNPDSDEAYDKWEEAQDLLGKFDSNPQANGIVYAEYEDYKKMKDIIGEYVWRHNGNV